MICDGPFTALGQEVLPMKIASTALAVALTTTLSCAATSSRPASYPYPPHGTVTRASSTPWEWIRDHASLPAVCGVQDNRWNQVHAAPGPSAQRVFVEDLGGTPAFGWQWVWPTGYDVVTYPEVICGTKPWDMGSDAYTLGGAFPFQPASQALAVEYDLALQSTGVHNVAFSLWAVSDTDHPLETLTDEIMIWVDNRGMTPAGAPAGTARAGAAIFDVWVNPGQTDHSGGSTATWTYVAFVAREPMLAGSLDLTPLLDHLREHDVPGHAGQRILPAGAWIGSLELGTEVVGGGGLVEVTGFHPILSAR
jgi:hypothetical protein